MNISLWESRVVDAEGNDRKVSDFRRDNKCFIFVNFSTTNELSDMNLKSLVDLYLAYKDRGLEILAFHNNEFSKEEPLSLS